jgi:type VI secretion system protein ImpC
MSDSDDWTADFGGIGQAAPRWAAKRPMRIAILGDFSSGALAGRLDTGAALAKRKPLKVEFDTLEDALARLRLKLQLPLGADGLPVEVDITDMESFHPDTLYQNLEVFSALASLRKRLNTPSTFAKAAAEVQGWNADAGPRASRVEHHARARGASPSSGSTLDDFARLTGRPAVSQQAEGSLDDLLRSLVGPFIVPAASPNKDALVASVDKALSDAMRAVLHQPDFQNAESLWRGVDFLLRRLETSHQLQVHLFDISAEELAADLSAVSDLADSGLYKLLVEQPSQDADGGYTYLCGAYTFDATPPHAELLGRAARVAAHAGAPFITAMQTDPFADRREPPHRLVRAAFTALKEMSDASFLGLIGPRFLLRHPYGKRSDPISSFAMEEFTREDGLRGMLWGHPSLLAMCARRARRAVDDRRPAVPPRRRRRRRQHRAAVHRAPDQHQRGDAAARLRHQRRDGAQRRGAGAAVGAGSDQRRRPRGPGRPAAQGAQRQPLRAAQPGRRGRRQGRLDARTARRGQCGRDLGPDEAGRSGRRGRRSHRHGGR